ncbi:MAG TPA: FtsX-like permease family protein, partial [Bacteroidales bacterium]|nr:FtsX-like permease family protein [Bacteroidales bacterium]
KAEHKYDKMDGLRLQALEKIHLYSEKVRYEMAPQGSITTVRIFGISAILILLLACVNFINLSTARSTQRFREVGMRKVIGSGKSDLIKQFLVETSIYVLLAVAIALVMAEISLPWFNNISGKAMSLKVFLEPGLLSGSILFILTLTLLAGLYPAFILSSYSPSVVLKGSNYTPGQGRSKFGLREGLVVFQFIISVALLSGSLLVQEQLSFIRNTNLGYDKNNRLAIVNPWDENIESRFDALKESLSTVPAIVSTTGTHNIPNEMQNNYGVFQLKSQSTDEYLHAAVISVESNFFKAMKSKIIAGENFPGQLTNQAKDSLNLCIINESAYKILKQNGTEKPLGKTLSGFWDKIPQRKVVGVVEDIHFRSLHDKVSPAVFLVSKSTYPNYILNLIVEYIPGHQLEVLEEVKDTWATLSPEWPIEYKFLDKDFDALYKREDNMATIMKVFTFIALLISSLGLVALSLLVLQSKVKQIGIRKVLGATENELVRMFTWRFVKLVLIANIIALPLMWYAAILWLDTFAYRTSINILMLAYVFGVSLIISAAVVYYQTRKTARSNPVEALRYE